MLHCFPRLKGLNFESHSRELERFVNEVHVLAARQLEAYNASDLDAFCDCYHEAVVVLDDREEKVHGLTAFRERYQALFDNWEFGAAVPKRIQAGNHCVDYETWWRIDPETGERTQGEVLVRYTEKEGKIAVVQFLK